MMLSTLHSALTSLGAAVSDAFSPRPRPPRPANLLSVANAVLDEIDRQGGSANFIRLQRLTILAQLWHIAIHDRPMFTDDMVVLAGRPALPGIHSAFRRHGTDAITGRARIPEVPQFEWPSDVDEGRVEVVRAVVRAYRRFDGHRLGVVLAETIEGCREGGIVDQGLAAERLRARGGA